jgi:hypothetical protein
MPWRRGLAVSSPPATEEIGDTGREIESRWWGGGFLKTRLENIENIGAA